jgi:hypothetical protein
MAVAPRRARTATIREPLPECSDPPAPVAGGPLGNGTGVVDDALGVGPGPVDVTVGDGVGAGVVDVEVGDGVGQGLGAGPPASV